MKALQDEVDANYERFTAAWIAERAKVSEELAGHTHRYLESYRRITSLQAWRSEMLEHAISADALAFFLEAQNDALVSHVMAHYGGWRSALQALRSCIENVLFCLYYKDHPVELILWAQGKHRLPFSEMHAYFSRHPDVAKAPRISGLDVLQNEYGTLSRAVHASASSFRMTKGEQAPKLFKSDVADVGAWATRERSVVEGLNLLLLSLFWEQLQGAGHAGLRKAISFALPAKRRIEASAALHVALYKR